MGNVPLEATHTAMAGFFLPLWAVPILIVVGVIGAWYRKKQDRDR